MKKAILHLEIYYDYYNLSVFEDFDECEIEEDVVHPNLYDFQAYHANPISCKTYAMEAFGEMKRLMTVMGVDIDESIFDYQESNKIIVS